MVIQKPVCRVAAAALLLAGWIGGCKHKPPGPEAVATRPRGEAPTTASIRSDDLQRRRDELAIIPPLGQGINFTDATGELWSKYPSGLMIHDLKREDGEVPQWGQTVVVAYKGTLPGATKIFDQRGADNPLSFPLGSKSYVMGFNMAISTMHLGSKRRVLIPSDLAYGTAGKIEAGINPDQPLIFEIELLAIKGDPVPLPELPEFKPLGPPMPADLAPQTGPATSAPAKGL